jgi:HlyD family secretion protein
MKNIFPNEIIENTTEVHRFKHQIKSKIIYGAMILSLLGAVISLPFIHMDIYSTAPGILKSEGDNNRISSLYSGKIKTTFIYENKYVQRGDTLLIIDNIVGKEKLILLEDQLEEVKTFIHDLTYLSNSEILKSDSLHSPLYRKYFLFYTQKIVELQTRYEKAKRDFIRQQKLYKEEVIAKVEYENSEYDLNLELNRLIKYKQQELNKWLSDLIQLNNQSKELKNTLSQYMNEQKNHIITSPINGSIQNIQGLEAGNFIISGSPIAEVSPDSKLIAECYISPYDIGLLSSQSNVKFQINAFNYNEWGMVTGKIISINKDISIVNNSPMFKVICSLDQKQLQLQNGLKGKLKKGMTLNARFFINNRSVFDLLFDKVDDWFNPSKFNK